ncbi:MAG: helix-turn-helix domain-containing protein [Thermoanaerobaculia bacterium]
MATRGRPRRPEADAEILDAALGMLRAGGYRELSLDEVARRAGTAKSSIYRRWQSKAALAAEIVRREVPAPEGDLAVAFDALMSGAMGGVVASLIGEAQESAETRSIVLVLLAPYRAAGDDKLSPILFRSLLNN